jgi:hypothetical protein
MVGFKQIVNLAAAHVSELKHLLQLRQLAYGGLLQRFRERGKDSVTDLIAEELHDEIQLVQGQQCLRKIISYAY